MNRWLKTFMALGALYLLMSLFLPANVKADNLIQTVELPCLLKPNPAYVIGRKEDGGSIGLEFGESYGGFKGLDVHNGIDWLSGGKILPVFAGASGTLELKVDTVEEELWRTGGKIIIRLDNPPEFLLMYFHLDYLEVTFVSLQEGMPIQKGQLIGFLAPDEWDPSLVNPENPSTKVSRMGYYASNPHLHLQARHNGNLIDPLPLFGEECSTDAVIYAEYPNQIILPQGSRDPLLGFVDLPVRNLEFGVPYTTPGGQVQVTPVADITTATPGVSVVQPVTPEDGWVVRNIPWNGVYYDVDVRKIGLILIIAFCLPVLTWFLTRIHKNQ